MKYLAAVLLVLCLVSECRATLVIVARTESGSIIAADSKLTAGDESDLGFVCKIHITDNTVWAIAGISRGPFNLLVETEAAIHAGGALDEISARFEAAVGSVLKAFLIRFQKEQPQQYERILGVQNNWLLDVVLLRDNELQNVNFFAANRAEPGDIRTVRQSCPRECWAIGAHFVMGVHDAIVPTGRIEEWLMIDALFWYTGLVAWILIVFGVVSGVVIEAHDRSVVTHGEQMKRS